MPITPNLRLSITNRETNKPFLNWRLGIDGPDDSNMIKLDKAWGDMKAKVDGAAAAAGHPYTAATAAEMTDHDKTYVYVGSETGYTNGDWYYWNENQSAWVSGGVFNATAMQTDDTLTLSGEAADARATGETIRDLENRALLATTTEGTGNVIIVTDADTSRKFPALSATIESAPAADGQIIDNAAGFTSIKLVQSGKNLFNVSEAETTRSYINSSGSIVRTSGATGWFVSGYMPVNPGSDMHVQVQGGTVAYHAFYRSNHSLISTVQATNSTLQVPNGARWIRCSIREGNRSTFTLSLFSDAEAGYTGQVTNIALPAEAGAVYFGDIDLVHGILHSTYGVRQFTGSDVVSFDTTSTGVPYVRVSNILHHSEVATDNVYSDRYKGYRATAGRASGDFAMQNASHAAVYIYDDRFTDETTAKQILDEEKPIVVYKKDAASEYAFTPPDITAYADTENLWVDCGPVSLSYIKAQTDDDSSLALQTISGVDEPIVSAAGVKSIRSLKVNIKCNQAGSGTPSPDNVRAISGYTGAMVHVSGINLYNNNDLYHGYFTPLGYIYADELYRTAIIEDLPAGNYDVAIECPGDRPVLMIRTYFDGVSHANERVGGSDGIVFKQINTQSRGKFMVCMRMNDSGAIPDGIRVIIRMGKDVGQSNYPLYSGSNYPVVFSSSVGTVYGGELDVVDGTLTVTYKAVTLSGTDFDTQGTTSGGKNYIKIKAASKLTVVDGDAVCDQYVVYRSADSRDYGEMCIINDGDVYIYDERFTSLATAQSILNENPVTVVYPVTEENYATSPTSITLGQTDNRIWVSCGNISEASFILDNGYTKECVDKLIEAAGDKRHLNIMIFGHSYASDCWGYVPFILKSYGITSNIYLYYRGDDSIYRLVQEWNDTGANGIDEWGMSHMRRLMHIDTRVQNEWDNQVSGYSPKMVLELANDPSTGIGHWDIITLQTAPTDVYLIKAPTDGNPQKGYEPYTRQAIELINASYKKPYSLAWFCSYTRIAPLAHGAYPVVSSDTFDNRIDTLRAAETICRNEPFEFVIPEAAAVFSARTHHRYAVPQASAYSASSTYALGDYVLYDDTVGSTTHHNLYYCRVAITTAEAWNSDHWSLVQVDYNGTDPIDTGLASPIVSDLGNLWFSDGVHLQNGIPRYIANLVVCQSIFKKFFPELSVLGDQTRLDVAWLSIRNLPTPSIHGGNNLNRNRGLLCLDEDLYGLAQKCAVAAVEHPFDITPIYSSDDPTELEFEDTRSTRRWADSMIDNTISKTLYAYLKEEQSDEA